MCSFCISFNAFTAFLYSFLILLSTVWTYNDIPICAIFAPIFIHNLFRVSAWTCYVAALPLSVIVVLVVLSSFLAIWTWECLIFLHYFLCTGYLFWIQCHCSLCYFVCLIASGMILFLPFSYVIPQFILWCVSYCLSEDLSNCLVLLSQYHPQIVALYWNISVIFYGLHALPRI